MFGIKIPRYSGTGGCCTPIIDALLQIFSRMEILREIETDQGRSFMSNLTMKFSQRFGIKLLKAMHKLILILLKDFMEQLK